MSEKPTILAGFLKSDITPDYPVSIIGYFNERISEGILDRLYLRAATFVINEKKLLFLQIDNCCIPSDDAEIIKNEISKQGKYRKEDILIFAIHTHTGPSLENFYDSVREEKYYEFLKSMLLSTAAKIEANQEVTVHIGETSYQDLAYNRRWFMKDGKVVTNPPKLHPDRVKPEGPADRNLRVISFHDKEDKAIALFCNISNHTDTVDGNLISADWPGLMETEIQNTLHSDIPVFTFIAPQGNINHFDFESASIQYGYEETQRIAKAYGEITIKALKKLKGIDITDIDVEILILDLPPREVSEKDIENAKEILEQFKNEEEQNKKLDANDIFKGNSEVKKIFARYLLEFEANKKQSYSIPLQVIRMGSIIFFAIPGEPFVEIGLKLIKTATEKYGYKMVFPVALANGYFGYIPLAENFSRGGYEISAIPGNPLSRSAAERITGSFIQWMQIHKQ